MYFSKSVSLAKKIVMDEINNDDSFLRAVSRTGEYVYTCVLL